MGTAGDLSSNTQTQDNGQTVVVNNSSDVDPITGQSKEQERQQLATKLEAAANQTGRGPGGLLPSNDPSIRAVDAQIQQAVNENADLNTLTQLATTLQQDQTAQQTSSQPTQSTSSSGNGNSQQNSVNSLFGGVLADILAASSVIKGAGLTGMTEIAATELVTNNAFVNNQPQQQPGVMLT